MLALTGVVLSDIKSLANSRIDIVQLARSDSAQFNQATRFRNLPLHYPSMT
jgi:hypothetical protein